MGGAERLGDGALRYRGAACMFVVSRLRPGALHLSVLGDDAGELGDAVFGELEREQERFGLPLRLYVDTRRATPPAGPVRDRWADWLRLRRSRLADVHILAPDAVLGLAVRVARELSGTGGLVKVGADADAFAARLDEVAPGCAALVQADRRSEPAVATSRRTSGRDVVLADESCRYEFRHLGSTLHVAISGHDRGRLGAEPLDVLSRWLREPQLARQLFVDASAVTTVAPRVRDEWVAWIGAHCREAGPLRVLAGSPLMRLTFDLAREAAGAGHHMRIYSEPARFAAELERHTAYAM
jgi:hypothetical protein